MSKVVELNHPLILHKLALLRNEETSSKEFRVLVKEISMLMVYEATKDFDTKEQDVKTPICTTECKVLAGEKVVIVPILRAGLGMMEGVLNLIPSAKVGHIGLARDEKSLMPFEYYCKLPQALGASEVIVVDPMLATGGSSIDALTLLKSKGAKKIRLMCLIGAPEGIRLVQEIHPDVDIYIAAIDEGLNENGYIVPGLGDAGDRIFGTE